MFFALRLLRQLCALNNASNPASFSRNPRNASRDRRASRNQCAIESLEDRIVLSSVNPIGGTANFVEYGKAFALDYYDVSAMEVGDLDNDGDDDIVISRLKDFDNSAVWLNDGEGNFTLNQDFHVANEVFSIELGDLNKDGFLDALMVTSRGDEIWFNDEDGSFTNSGQSLSNGSASGSATGDVDGDGDLDLVITHSLYGLQIYTNNGSGVFPAAPTYLGVSARDVAVGDLNGDGYLDLFLVDDSADDQVFFNDGNGNFTASTQLLGHQDSATVRLGDLDGDGDLDAVIGTDQSVLNVNNESLIWLNDGTGQFVAGPTLDTNFVKSAELGDLDGDGDLDIFISEFEASGSSVWLNNGSAQFTSTGQVLPAWSSAVTRLADLDGDGDLDAVQGVRNGRSKILWNDVVELPFRQNFIKDWGGFNILKDENAFHHNYYNGYESLLYLYTNNVPPLSTAIVGTGPVLPEAFNISVDMSAVYNYPNWSDGFVVFDYKNENDFKYVGALMDENQWIIGHFQGDFSNQVAMVDLDDTGGYLFPGILYQMYVSVDGNEVSLNVNGVFITSGTFSSPVNEGRVGVAVYNGVTTFDNFVLSEPNSLPFEEDFETVFESRFFETTHEQWSGETTSAGTHYTVDATNGTLAISVAIITEPLPEQFVIRSEITATKVPNRWQDGFIIFDYVSDTNFKFAGMFAGQNQWVVGQYYGNFNEYRLLEVDWDDIGRDIVPGESYDVRIEINGMAATLFVNDGEIGTATFTDPLNSGGVGMAARNAKTEFDNFFVGATYTSTLPALDYVHKFGDGSDDFTPNNPAIWNIQGVNNDEYVADSTSTGGLAVSTVTLSEANGPISQHLEIETEVVATTTVGHWSDGFIVFDYKSENDFKYAGFFGGHNQWVIGHYRGHWGNRLAMVDWDDTGRDILANGVYTMTVEIHDNEVDLIVNGELITSADFNTTLTYGAIGLANYNAKTTFRNFSAKDIAPVPSPVDSAFAGYDGSLTE
ncbi:MAG: hypothetical protein CMJ46_02235 [Planctomyces sp.]|nr:hypothetical protein [Planctomyces sp.]